MLSDVPHVGTRVVLVASMKAFAATLRGEARTATSQGTSNMEGLVNGRKSKKCARCGRVLLTV